MADPAIKYGGGVDFENANTSHSRMLRLIGANKRVLEFGCSSGYMARALQQQGCSVTAIEIDPAVAELAKPFCERVIIANLDGGEWATRLADTKFDVALFGDVLEQLKDPMVPLVLVRRFLADGGYLVASIPNVAHGSVRLALLQGEFKYRDKGLLDDTHLRFFTRASIEELFRNARYEIDVMERSTAGVFETEIHVNERDVPTQLLWQLNCDEDALTYQFIYKTKPVDASKTALMPLTPSLKESPASISVSAIMQRLRDTETQLERVERQNALQKATLENIFNSKGWRFINRYRELKGWVRSSVTLARNRQFKTFVRSSATRLLTLVGVRRHVSTGQDLYKQWIAIVEPPRLDVNRLRAETQSFTYRPLISILMPVYNPSVEHLRKAIESVKAQVYDNWELCICDDASTSPEVRLELETADSNDSRIKVRFNDRNVGISQTSNYALEMASGEFVGLLDHDDELAVHALHENVALLQHHPEADLIYSDEDKLDAEGQRVDPFFKPDWSPEYMLSCMYTCHFGMYRAALLKSIGGFRRGFEGSQDYDLVLRLSEKSKAIFHIPQMLYHWRMSAGSTAAFASAKDYTTERGWRALQEHLERRGLNGTVEKMQLPNRYRVRPAIKGEPLVSIIIPTKDGVPLLKRCLQSIESKTEYKNYEVLIVDNNSEKPETAQYLATLKHRVIPFPEPFNYSRINNHAAEQAKGDYLLLLNNDTEVISPGWITAMLEFAQLDDVGAVGAKLYYPNNHIQHAGVVLGICGGAGHSHKYYPRSSRGYFDSLACIRNYSAVTAACIMVRRQVYEEVGGFDEQFRVAFNDVDFCLRIRQKGYRIVWTPFAELYHYESASRGLHMDLDELSLLQERWSSLLRNDPYYNPNLTLDSENYTLAC